MISYKTELLKTETKEKVEQISVVKTARIIAKVGLGDFRPGGSKTDWVEYAKAYKKQNDLDEVEVWYDVQDKETGYTDTYFLCKV